MKLPNNLLITADWHLRGQKPRCRIDDDWIQTQKNALEQISNLAIKRKTNVFLVGDIFHCQSETSFEIIQMVQNFAKKLKEYDLSLYVLFGNHDLLYHSSENIKKSAVGILIQSENIFPISTFENTSAPNFDKDSEDCEFMFKHVLVFPDLKSIPPMCDGLIAKDLLEEFPKAKWIFTGDYHKHFHYEKNGRHVVNPGCLLRQVSDMKDYQCGVYYVDTDSGEVEFIEIKDNDDFIDDSYIIKEQEKEERIEKFASKLNETENISLDYLDNVKRSMKENKFNDDLVNVIEELLEV